MKKLINKTIILSLFVALTGCNDWLDVSPKADMKAEDLFGTEAGFRDALVGVYALMLRQRSDIRLPGCIGSILQQSVENNFFRL